MGSMFLGLSRMEKSGRALTSPSLWGPASQNDFLSLQNSKGGIEASTGKGWGMGPISTLYLQEPNTSSIGDAEEGLV